MRFIAFRRGLVALAAGFTLAGSGGASARPIAVVETVCFPAPSGDGPVFFDQAFFWGGYQYPAGGYNGGPYRARAYSAADVYVSPPVCVTRTVYEARDWRVKPVMRRTAARRRCACALR